MSTHIEYRHLAVCARGDALADVIRAAYPALDEFAANHVASQGGYIVFTEDGASNCTRIDHRGREVLAKDWGIGFVGDAGNVIRQAVLRSVHTIGGMLTLSSARRDTTPEKYIRAYRTALANALSVYSWNRRFRNVQIELRFPKACLEADTFLVRPFVDAHVAALREAGRLVDDGEHVRMQVILFDSEDPIGLDLALLGCLRWRDSDYPQLVSDGWILGSWLDGADAAVKSFQRSERRKRA